MLRSFFAALTRNPLSLLGSAITTAAALLILTLFGMSLVGLEGSPYIGILVYLILPLAFLIGLLLIPVGILRQRRAEKAAGVGPSSLFPIYDLNRPKTRHALLLFLIMSAVNLVIIAVATYKGVEVMDSVSFCGTTCHTVMQPEYTAYRHSPHARVACVDCHIGPGANWFVKSKLSGAWQVLAVIFKLYPRPIPTPVANLRPARETCEQCHWPEKFEGDRLQAFTRYAADQENTVLHTVLLMRIGGLRGNIARGIHWHVAPGVRIRYRSNPERTVIPVVEVSQPNRPSQLFTAGDDRMAKQPWRTMDCIDCHNRPTHILVPPGRAIDTALELGRVSPALPFVKREGMRIVQAPYPSRAQARVAIPAALLSFYRESYPTLLTSKMPEIQQAGSALADAYLDNVFPAMKVGWETYRDFLGHTDEASGCFRCHDWQHASQSGNTISQDCSLCHEVLADQEKKPPILQQLAP